MKTVVITGSTRGIGLSMAKEFIKAGCNVALSGRAGEAPDAVRALLHEFPGRALYIPCNVRLQPDLKALWSQSAAKWGKVDIWVNNAGQNCPLAFVQDTDQASVDAVIDTNIKGVIFGTQIAAQHMLAQGGGQIWNMEGLGSNDMIQVKTILYGTTKHALTYFTKGVARELEGTPVKAGRLSPGMMLTDFITKTPEGAVSPVLEDRQFLRIFNTLADHPETVAGFFIPRMLANQKNNAHIVWLTNAKAAGRFMTSAFRKRKLLQ